MYDVYLQSPSLVQAGGIQFASNKYLLSLPYKLGPSNVDYAKVRMSSDGHIVAEVDYSNIDNPAVKSPLRFVSEPSIGFTERYGPPTGYVAYAPSWIAVAVRDKGVADGIVQLTGAPGAGPFYSARIFWTLLQWLDSCRSMT
ncbi:hypothetical protein Focb16_v015696 [Fusarium oxysporum f. sp. cubense]|uniref:Uncharacterized protein n=1 Tax=Fusarium oxysporum f. sp. cubense TaxID=61366 RepID=A0A559KXH9_FUSOC|nr:hypothetical protein Focb16_v015696 [Fusarium oxysporum f. sp. cubense]